MPDSPNKLLKSSVKLWFIIAVLGQWFFALYIALYFGGLVALGGPAGLAESHLPKSYIAGDIAGNLAVAAHLFLSIVTLVGGPLQLMPQIRNRFPKFHRWNGRIYLSTGVILALSGLYMVWVRRGVGDLPMHIGISINGLLILLFAYLAYDRARNRDMADHRRWAIRLFLAMNGVWFARVILWLWVRHTDATGIDFENFTGPFLTFLNVAQYLVPLIILECYFYAQKSKSKQVKLAVTALLLLASVVTVFGLAEAADRLWLPKM